MHDDATDLRRFAEEGDGGAFAALVRRHLGLVYSASLRQVNGDAHLAQDVAQSVFTDLARKAGALAPRAATLAGWLYTSTHHAAAHAVRAEQRRRRREQEAHAMQELADDSAHDAAWAQVRPHIDALMQRLSRQDRDAIVQRYFAGRSFPEMAAMLGVSENGARMRVERALEKLRRQLERHGIHSTMAALGTAMATEAMAAPPAGLAAAVTSAALAKVAGVAAAATTLGILGMTKIQTAITATAALAGLALVGVEIRDQREARASLEELRASSALDDAASNLDTIPAPPAPLAEPAALAELRAEKASLENRLRQRRTAMAAPAAASAAPGRARPASTFDPATVFDFKDLDVKPKPLTRRAPKYPFDLRGIPGEAVVSFVITESGEVADIQPEDATHPAFAIAAMDAVAEWRFSPGERAGVPVNVRVQQPLFFKWTEDDWF